VASGYPPPPQPIDPLGVALGTKFEPFPASVCTAATAPATQSVWGTAVYATAGSSITGLKLRNSAAAAGSLPTTARFGLADNTGKILVLSANLNALASWPTGAASYPFTAPLTLTYSGVYFPCFVVNGTWGSTQPTPIRCANSNLALTADGTNPPVNFVWAGQTDLPAVGSSVTITGATGTVYWIGLY